MLELNHLSKKYGKKAVLDCVSMSVQHGDIAILLGHSGVGKSTLLRAINDLESFDSGEIVLNGETIDPAKRNGKHPIGMVFQNYHIFDHLTAIENIRLPLEICLQQSKEDSKEKAEVLLAQYNLSEKAGLYPSQLSGGQKQRLAIARAVAMGPSVLCMDEPTSALDPLTTNQVAKHIETLAETGYMILIATHDTALIEKFDCDIHLMEEGKIVESVRSVAFLEDRSRHSMIDDYLSGKR